MTRREVCSWYGNHGNQIQWCSSASCRFCQSGPWRFRMRSGPVRVCHRPSLSLMPPGHCNRLSSHSFSSGRQSVATFPIHNHANLHTCFFCRSKLWPWSLTSESWPKREARRGRRMTSDTSRQVTRCSWGQTDSFILCRIKQWHQGIHPHSAAAWYAA